MTIPSEILNLWKQYSTTVFPKGYGAKQIGGIDLALLDAEISGFVRQYINTANLELQQIRTLRDRLIDLNTVMLLLEGDQLTYFNRLRELANLVLQELKDK